MSILNHLAQAAAVILLVELLVLLLLLLGIAGGLAFGLRWVRGKTDPAFAWTNRYLETAPRYAERVSDVATLPFVKLTGVMRYVQVTAQVLRESVRRREAAQTSRERATSDYETMTVGARPIPSTGEVTESVEPAPFV